MFESEEIVWHDKYGRGQVAAWSGSVTYVLWDNPKYNDTRKIPPEVIKDENDVVIKVLPSEAEGSYLYIDESDLDYARNYERHKKQSEGKFEFQRFTPGWYKLLKVTQQMMRIWDEKIQNYRIVPAKGKFLFTLQRVGTNDRISEFAAAAQEVYVPKAYATDTLSILSDDFTSGLKHFTRPGLENNEPKEQEEGNV